MARLTMLRPTLGRVKPTMSILKYDVQRDAMYDHRPWYKLQRWRKLRWAVLVRDGFTCKECGKVEGRTSLLVADHIEPHRGDERLFWDVNNLQCLCKRCHDSMKQRAEQGSRR